MEIKIRTALIGPLELDIDQQTVMSPIEEYLTVDAGYVSFDVTNVHPDELVRLAFERAWTLEGYARNGQAAR